MDKLSLFFAHITELTFWQRIFSWSSVRTRSSVAAEQYKSLERQLGTQQSELDDFGIKVAKLETEKTGLNGKIQEAEKATITKDHQLEHLTRQLGECNQKISFLNTEVLKFESVKEERQKDYETRIAQLNQVKTGLESEQIRLNDERIKEKEEDFDRMKSFWSDHQTAVEQRIKQLCQTYLIKYIDKVPFKGSPDNTIEICNEYIIFDAKSPANDDLTHFPKYIKAQTDNVKKYASQEAVRKDIFLVVPSNTIDKISPLSHNMGDYNVYIIASDSLEPIILSLKKIEEYEFVDQLRPEERDNICRVIGKFAHTTKRKIQVDQFFVNQFIELLVKCKKELPESFLQSVIEFEKAEKLNPPTERRAEQILTKELQDKNDSINAEAQLSEISIPGSFDDVKQLE